MSENTNRFNYSSRANRTGAKSVTIKAIIAGMAGISKRGSSPLILSARTSYVGETIVTVGGSNLRASGADHEE